MEPVAFAPHLTPGQILDGAYEIGPVIGRGGMATVYEGRSLETGRVFAIKMLRDSGEEAGEAQRRFFNELLLASSLKHRRIVEVHDFGVAEDGSRYIVMERLRGHTVGQEIRRFGRMGPERTVHRLLEAIEALELAHARGIVHSDLKPTNLFLNSPSTPQESLTVLDFGVAHRIASSGQAVRGGTPRYAPPELLLGQPTGPQSDVYQLGMVLAEMLSGEAVLQNVTTVRQCLDVHAEGPVRLPLPLQDSGFREVVVTAVAMDVSRRYRSVAELREALLVAWLRHQSGPRSFGMVEATFEGTLDDEESRTVRFEDSMADEVEEEEHLVAAVVTEEEPLPPVEVPDPAPLVIRRSPVLESGEEQLPKLQPWMVVAAVAWCAVIGLVAAMAGVLGTLWYLQK